MSKFSGFNNDKTTKNKQDVYTLLETMTYNMGMLFDSLGLEEKPCNIKTPNEIIKVVQSLMASGVLKENITAINEKLLVAVDSNVTAQMQLAEMTKAIEQYKNEIERLNYIIQVKDTEIGNLRADVSHLKQNIDSKTKEFDEIITACNEKITTKEKEHLSLLQALISFRDSIALRDGMAKNVETVDGKKLLASFLKETRALFEKNGVQVIESKGNFDLSIQVVTDVVDTTEPALHDTVSEVFRAGYMTIEGMLRPEEVILFRYTKE